MDLILSPNIDDPDGFFDALLAAHDGRSDAESQAYTTRLMLVLANHIGDRDVLEAAMVAAD